MLTFGSHAAEASAIPDKAWWLVVPASRHRDSDELANSNFEAALSRLGGNEADVMVLRQRNWAVGWTETLLVRPGSQAAAVAAKIEAALDSYPVLDDRLFSKNEHDAYLASWRSWAADDFRRDLKSVHGLSEAEGDRLDDVSDGALRLFFETNADDCRDGAAPLIAGAARRIHRAELDALLEAH